MRISDWSSDVCSSDLFLFGFSEGAINSSFYKAIGDYFPPEERAKASSISLSAVAIAPACAGPLVGILVAQVQWQGMFLWMMVPALIARSEEHTSELQSLMRISYAVFCLQKTREKKQIHQLRLQTQT